MVDTHHLMSLEKKCGFTVAVIVGYALLVDQVNDNSCVWFAIRIASFSFHFNALSHY